MRTRSPLMNRILCLTAFLSLLGEPRCSQATAAESPSDRPNIIIAVTDDQGWGDTSYNGHPELKTPNLDAMAENGIRFDRFYASAPVCTPTRAAILTGRHPNRYGLFWFSFRLPHKEKTIAELLRDHGYQTGHFGKWHVGWTEREVDGLGVIPRGTPETHGYHHYVARENWFDIDPHFMVEDGRRVNVKGETSRLTVDAALKFAGENASTNRPFFMTIWFPSPHSPCRALPEDKEPFRHLSEAEQEYYGELTAVDREMGRLRSGLRDAGIANNTMLWFCSDNGPSPEAERPVSDSTGGLRGGKFELYEGGLRVPGILEWPAVVKSPRRTSSPAGTIDFVPTICDLLDIPLDEAIAPMDGVSLMPLILGESKEREKPLVFEIRHWDILKPGPEIGNPQTAAIIDGQYKAMRHVRPNGVESWRLYNLKDDPTESADVKESRPDIFASLRQQLLHWEQSVDESLSGADYDDGLPVDNSSDWNYIHPERRARLDERMRTEAATEAGR